MKRKTYPSDLSDEQWKLLETMLPPAERRGRKRRVCLRQVLNALRYILRTGCAWRYLPSEYPNWTSVYYYFQKWRDSDWFAAVNDALRRRLRLQQGRDENPSAGIVDAQSVKTSNDDAKGFVVLPRRWVVERTFAWLSKNRRLSKDYERDCQTSEAWIYLAMTNVMLKHVKLEN